MESGAVMTLGGILADAKTIQAWIVNIRRELHRHPELQYQEVKTSAVVRRELAQLGISFDYPIAETGVVARIGSGDGPCVALRADMDALPINEQADVTFRSESPGKMHACGHDCHTAMLLGAARLLKSRESEIPGTIKFLFQPAEEWGAGGQRMVNEGALRNPEVQRVFGLHVWPQLPTGTIGGRAGTLLAATSSLKITIQGRGGHAAFPHFTIDPVLTMAKVVTELQSIVSREIDPLDSAVVSITAIHGGETFNVIPETAMAIGTIRSLSLDGIQSLQQRIREIASLIAEANRCQARVEFPDVDYPPTVNDEHCWKVACQLGGELLGAQRVHELPPVLGGEDFAFYAQVVPGCFVALGVRNDAIGATYNVHHPKFKVDEDALPIGAAMHVAFALRSLAELQR